MSLLLLLALGTAAGARADPEVELVAIKAPPPKPLSAMDKDVKLGFYLRPDLASKNPTGYRVSFPLEELGPAGMRQYQYFFVYPLRYPTGVEGPMHVSELISLDLAQAFSEQADRIVRSLFPSSAAASAADSSGFEILAAADFNARWLEDPSGDINGLQVEFHLEFVGSNGERVDLVIGNGRARPASRVYWSTATRWRSVAQEAVTQAVDDLVRTIRASQPLALQLATLAEARALPAGLETVASFDDSTAFVPNGRLDAGEQALVNVVVVNNGPGPAHEVAARAVADLPQVAVSAPVAIGTLLPGARREITIPVAGKLDLPSQLLRLRVETSEKRGYDGRPLVLEVAAGALRPARLEIVDVTWNDSTGRAHGDGDGRPANGETLEAVVRIRNAGPGDAARVAVSAAPSKPGVELLAATTVLDRIAANEVAEARLLVGLPAAYPEAELQLAFAAVDSRGPEAGSAGRTETWPVQVKRVAVGVRHRVFDGNSPGSLGNRDGQVNNGERVELVLTPFNRGDLPARETHIAVEAATAGLLPQPDAFSVGTLPPHTEGAEQRLLLAVPRELGGEREIREIRLTLTISQQDFAPTKAEVVVPFHLQRPEISVDAGTVETLSRGTQGTLVFQVRNDGELAAEDLIVEISTAARGVELLDDRGVPGSKRRFAIGALGPSTASAQLSLPVLAKQSATVGSAPLAVAILQRGFPPSTQAIDLAIGEGDVAVISAVVPAATTAVPSGGQGTSDAAAPAAIAFLHHSTGDHLTAEDVILRFEVQARDEPVAVRLTQNDRLLPTAGARRTTTSLGNLRLSQYEVPTRLDPGENHFEVVVVTREGIRSHRQLSLIRDWQRGRLWVVAIGVGNYADPTIAELRFAAADATAIHKYFRETFDLPTEQAFLRTDQQATLREIKSLLGTQLAARANNPDDTVIIYFAGHGFAEAGTGSRDADRLSKYLLPHDTILTDPYSTALDMDEITNIVRRLVPGRVIVIIDSCFSGAAGGRSPFDPGRDQPRALITDEFLDRLSQVSSGRIVLAASSPDEVAGEREELGHGVFTYYLLEGLRGRGDIDQDGDVDVHELFAYVSRQVASATRGKQHPVMKASEASGAIPIGRSSRAAAPSPERAPAKPERP